MTAYDNQATLAASTGFRGRAQVAMATWCRTVRQQTYDPAVERHDVFQRRQDFALKVLSTQSAYLDMVVWALVSIPTITDLTTDTVLQNTVDQIMVNLAKG
jgi:hypothetical protein